MEVVDVWPTLQGEGPYAGWPAVFVRTAGCNLQCDFCDTDYTSNRTLYTAAALWEKVQAMLGPSRLVVITGGEPFRQNLIPFIKLATKHVTVQIETNGTLWLEGLPEHGVILVCSPKTSKIHSHIADRLVWFKYIIEAGKVDRYDGLPTDSLGVGVRPYRRNLPGPDFVYVQPLDSMDPVQNKANQDAAVQSCLKYGYTLCLQLHKIVGLK